MPVNSFAEDIDYTLENTEAVSSWIENAVTEEGKDSGDISYIFCSDKYLHDINLKYLKHDDYTDVITFDYTDDELVSGDIFISIERIVENADKFDQNVRDELHRVMIHGVLHLLGYKDKTPQASAIMRSKEDYYLTLRPFL